MIGRANNILRQVFALPPREPSAVAPMTPRDRPLAMLQEMIGREYYVRISPPRQLESAFFVPARS